MAGKGPILLAAGGTGGHLFPAEALAAALAELGIESALVTDRRASGFVSIIPPGRIFQVPSATPSGRSPLKMAGAALTLMRGVFAARRLIHKLRPSAVVGFGGYPTVPPIFAASSLGVPTIIHEQNAVMGRANRFLASRVDLIGTGFKTLGRVPEGSNSKLRHVGIPVRPAVLAVMDTPFPPMTVAGKFRLAVFGGSQGARVMSEIVPAAIEKLPGEIIKRLSITQQARAEDAAQVREFYKRYGVEADVQPFFKDLPQRIAESHLVISRAGASTVAELAVIGRPSILVPLPGSLDQDQAANARTLSDIGAALTIPQSEFTPKRLASEIAERAVSPVTLTRAAAAAKSAGIPDAARQLAALVAAHAGFTPGA